MRKHLFYVALGELQLKIKFAKIICFYLDKITNVHSGNSSVAIFDLHYKPQKIITASGGV